MFPALILPQTSVFLTGIPLILVNTRLILTRIEAVVARIETVVANIGRVPVNLKPGVTITKGKLTIIERKLVNPCFILTRTKRILPNPQPGLVSRRRELKTRAHPHPLSRF